MTAMGSHYEVAPGLPYPEGHVHGLGQHLCPFPAH